MGATQKTIEVVVDEVGNVKIEASGFSGGACLKETASIEEALGKVNKRTAKSEMHKGIQIGDKAILGKK